MKAVSIQRTNAVLLCGILICIILFYAKPVLIPVTAATMLAMLVTPIANWLEKKKFRRISSTLLCLLLLLVIFASVIMLVAMQARSLGEQIPKAQEKIMVMKQQLQSFIETKWNVSAEKQMAFAQQQADSFLSSSGSFLKKFMTGLTSVIGGIVLIIVFTFLFLYQREKYETFFLKLYKGSNADKAKEVLEKTAKVAQYYLLGRLISVAILTALLTLGLTIIGIKNAFLLSFIAALLTIIPYVGSIVGGLFPVMVALVTEDSFTPAMWTLGVMVLVQSIDNYFIEPYVVGGEVNISAFFTILILAIGGFLWGVAGMVLFIPLLGIAKIVFDNVEELQPYGYLVGDQEEGRPSSRWLKRIKGWFGK